MVFWRRRVETVAFLVFGLGNPGLNYARSRHNLGWWVLDELARRQGVGSTVHRHRGQADYCLLADRKAALVKPTTLMNRSGACVRPWTMEQPEASWIVVCDDFSMAAGKLRLRRRGSSGGHRGLESIIAALGTEDFMRLKIGVGEPPAGVDAAEWVLSAPSPQDEDRLAEAVQKSADVLALVAAGQFEDAQQLTGGGS
jgi:PTH1 family peptidyl-tRNA hydrolase